MPELLIYTELPSARLHYTTTEIFEKFATCSVVFTTSISDFSNHPAPIKICYHAEKVISDCVHIMPHGLLAESGISNLPIAVNQHPIWQHIFFMQPKGDLPFDLLAATFYLLSRYEEYVNTQTDDHGRYAPENSLAYQHGFLEIPLIDVWRQQLFGLLQLDFVPRAFRFQPTFDIDHAYRYKGLTSGRWLLKWVKSLLSLRVADAGQQLAVAMGKTKDPYDTYDDIKQLCSRYGIQPHFFFLMNGKTRFDKQVNTRSALFQNLVRYISGWGKIGIHPSYTSMQELQCMENEKQELEYLLSEKVNNARQHFLRFQFPHTMNGLIQCGITHDYSLGYSKYAGFRASTSFSFNWYNLIEEQTTPLILHPLALMDTTLRYGMRLSPHEAKNKIDLLMHQVKKTNGTFISIWHNSNLSQAEGWQEWKDVFVHLYITANR